MRILRALGGGAALAVALALPAGAQSPVPPPYVPEAVGPAGAPPRSIVLDQKRVRDLAPVFVERIDVEGVDPDARRPKPKTLEQRFADSLGAPRTGLLGTVFQPLDTRPCPSLASTFTNIGTAYNPYGFCP